MTTKTNSVLNTVKEAFAPVTRRSPSFRTSKFRKLP